MTMAAIVRSGAGEVVRADRVSVRHIREAVVRMISATYGRRGAKIWPGRSTSWTAGKTSATSSAKLLVLALRGPPIHRSR